MVLKLAHKVGNGDGLFEFKNGTPERRLSSAWHPREKDRALDMGPGAASHHSGASLPWPSPARQHRGRIFAMLLAQDDT